MTEQVSALFSHYIIDGARQDATPAELLAECAGSPDGNILRSGICPGEEYWDIIDETTEPPLTAFAYDSCDAAGYLDMLKAANPQSRRFPLPYPGQFTRLRIASALIDMIWREGHFRLGNLRIRTEWTWDTAPVGSMAAFYESVKEASSYMYDLGVRLSGYDFRQIAEGNFFKAEAWLPEKSQEAEDTEDDSGQAFSADGFTEHEIPFRLPYESRHPWTGPGRKCGETIAPDMESILIYIPFDTCGYRLGGSMLSEALGQAGGTSTNIQDPDYFIDCYEVVRELTEDGIIMSGTTVSDGGLMTAADRMAKGQAGLSLDISGLMSSYGESCLAKVLFGEVPGVLVQVSDTNYDYFDSQLLLQDVAYYPVGRPSSSCGQVTLGHAARPGVADILAALLGQASEGED
jgi:hypothetical protein